MGAYCTQPDAEAQRPVSLYQTRPVGPGGLLNSTELDGAAFGQLSFYVRCERPVIGRMCGNGYDDLNQTRGSLGLPNTSGMPTGRVRYSRSERLMLCPVSWTAASGQPALCPVKGYNGSI